MFAFIAFVVLFVILLLIWIVTLAKELSSQKEIHFVEFNTSVQTITKKDNNTPSYGIRLLCWIKYLKKELISGSLADAVLLGAALYFAFATKSNYFAGLIIAFALLSAGLLITAFIIPCFKGKESYDFSINTLEVEFTYHKSKDEVTVSKLRFIQDGIKTKEAYILIPKDTDKPFVIPTNKLSFDEIAFMDQVIQYVKQNKYRQNVISK